MKAAYGSVRDRVKDAPAPKSRGGPSMTLPDHLHQTGPLVAHQLQDPVIESGEATALSVSERHQVSIGDLAVADGPREDSRLGVGGRHVVGPEGMSRLAPDLAEEGDDLGGGPRTGDDPCVAGDPHEARLGQRTGRPPVFAHLLEPLEGPRVMHVVRPGERHQDVDVQEADQGSSRASRTMSDVMGGASSRTRKTGKSEE